MISNGEGGYIDDADVGKTTVRDQGPIDAPSASFGDATKSEPKQGQMRSSYHDDPSVRSFRNDTLGAEASLRVLSIKLMMFS